MTTCDICGRPEDLASRFYTPQAKINLHSRDKTVQLWSGDLCEKCFRDLVPLVKESVEKIVAAENYKMFKNHDGA